MNENFFVTILFNLLIVSIVSCCLNLLFSSSIIFLNKLYKIVLWLITIGFYEPYFNTGISTIVGNSDIEVNSPVKKYNLSKYNFNGLTNLTNFLIKFGLLFANGILFGIIFMRWVTSGYFPISNLYESLMFLTWCLLTLLVFIYLFYFLLKNVNKVLFYDLLFLLLSIFFVSSFDSSMENAHFPLILYLFIGNHFFNNNLKSQVH